VSYSLDVNVLLLRVRPIKRSGDCLTSDRCCGELRSSAARYRALMRFRSCPARRRVSWLRAGHRTASTNQRDGSAKPRPGPVNVGEIHSSKFRAAWRY
jgi:hypothetical protein